MSENFKDINVVYEEKIVKQREILRIRNLIRGYISGFFDAEGTIGFKEESGTSDISFKQTYRPVLDEIEKYLKTRKYPIIGTINKYVPKNKNKISFRLRIPQENSENFLEYIYPNLIEKREQAKILLYYLKNYKESVRDYFRLSDTQKQQRKFVADELKRLKHRQYNDEELKNYENELKLLKIPKDIREGIQSTILDLGCIYEELVIENNLKIEDNKNLEISKEQIPMSEDILLGYLTGFYDGEGYVGIHKGKRDSYRLKIAVTNSNFDILNIYKNKYGGKIRPKSKDKTVKEYYKKLWLWELSNTDTLQFLQDIYPYSKVKKEQIKFAIEFQEWHDKINIIKSFEQKKKAEYYRLKLIELKKETGEDMDEDDIEDELIDKNQNNIDKAWN